MVLHALLFSFYDLIEPNSKNHVLRHNKWWPPHFIGGDFGLFVCCIGQVSNYRLHMVTNIWNRDIKAFHSWKVVHIRFHYHVDEEVLWDHSLSTTEQWHHILIEYDKEIFFGGE